MKVISRVVGQFNAAAGRRYDWPNAVGLATSSGAILISMPDLNETNASDLLVTAAVMSLNNPAVVAPGTDDSPPAVLIKSVDVKQQAGTFPHKFTIKVEVYDERGITDFYYGAAVDGRSSGWVRYFVPPDGLIPFDVDYRIFSVAFKATDTVGQTSAVASFSSKRNGNTFSPAKTFRT